MRWFSYKNRQGSWCLNSLMSTEDIKNGIEGLPKHFEAFASIQNYDVTGVIQSCPLYIDIDASSLYDAWETTKDTWCKLKSDFEIAPHVFFSGSKGFHLIMPLLIRHSQCHTIAREIATDYCTDLDTKVYSSRRMWRCNGSINKKSGRYKIRVPDISMPLETIIANAENGIDERHNKFDFIYYQSSLFDEMVEDISKELTEYRETKSSAIMDMSNLDPCIKSLWLDENPPEGTRNNTLYLLAKTCRRIGLTKQEAIAKLFNHPYWGVAYEKRIGIVVSSVYAAAFAEWSCLPKRSEGDIMRRHCVKRCMHHPDFAFWH